MSVETTPHYIDVCEGSPAGEIGDVSYWQSAGRVTMNYAELCASIRKSLDPKDRQNDTEINTQFDRTLIARLHEYYARDFPDNNLPPHLVLRVEGVPSTPWLGGFRLIQEQYLQTGVHMPRGMYSQEDVPKLTFETPDGTQLLPSESEDNIKWWDKHSQSMGLSKLDRRIASLVIYSSMPPLASEW